MINANKEGQIRYSVAEKRTTLLQHKNDSILNSTDLSHQPRNVKRFTLGGVEGSTLNMVSMQESKNSQSLGYLNRASSAANYNNTRKVSIQEETTQRSKDLNYQDMVVRSSLKTQQTHEIQKLIRDSPVNTVFQKLVVQDVHSVGRSLNQTSVRQIEANSAMNLNLEYRTQQSQKTNNSSQQAQAIILQKQLLKNSDRLMISVKPLHEERFSVNSHGDKIQNQTNASRVANQSFTEEDSEDESPTNMDRLSNVPTASIHFNEDAGQKKPLDPEQEQQEMKDAGTGPMFAEDEQSNAFRTQTSFPPVDSYANNVMGNLNFFNSEIYMDMDIGEQKQRSQEQAYKDSTAINTIETVGADGIIKIDPNRVIAQIATPKTLFGEKQIDRALQSKGFHTHRYICLQLSDLVWVHNYLVAEIIKKKREITSSKMTKNGKEEQLRRHVPNPQHLRNKNLAPAGFKTRLESKVVKQVQKERQFQNDLYHFMLQLLNKKQITYGPLDDKTIIEFDDLIKKPQDKLKLMTKLIKDAQAKTKHELMMLDNQFQTGQELYSEFLAKHQHPNQNTQKLSQPSQAAPTTPQRIARSTNKLQIQKLNDSEYLPQTITMSNAVMASFSQSQVSEDYHSFKKVAAPHHLSIVTKVTEPRPPPASSFGQQNRPKSKSKSTVNRKRHQRSKHGAESGEKRRENMEGLLKVEQVKVNQQNMTSLPEHKGSFTSGIALGTQRLDSIQGIITEGSKEYFASGTEMMQTPFAEQSQDSIHKISKTQLSVQLINQAEMDKIPSMADLQEKLSRGLDDQHSLGVLVIENQETEQLRPEDEIVEDVDEGTIQMKEDEIATIENFDHQKRVLQHKSGNVYGGSSSFDMTAVLLQDYNGFMQEKIKKDEQQSLQTHETHSESRQQRQYQYLSNEKSTSPKPDKESARSSVKNLQVSSKGQNSMQRMEVNLQKDFHEMRKFVQSAEPAVGVTGTRVKTYTGRPIDILKASKECAAKKKVSPEKQFDQIKQNQMSVKQGKLFETQHEGSNNNNHRSSSVLTHSKNQQKVILINKNDLYKGFDPEGDKPMWNVPTAKKTRKQAQQPRQRTTSQGGFRKKQENNPYASAGSQESIENASETRSQAQFYRTTRSIQAGQQSFGTLNQSQDTTQNHLAIDKRNTIHLQKAIDQYYDGDLDFESIYNGDLHSMQHAQSKKEQSHKIKQQQQQQQINTQQSQSSKNMHSQQDYQKQTQLTQQEQIDVNLYTLGNATDKLSKQRSTGSQSPSVHTVFTKANEFNRSDKINVTNSYDPTKSKLQGAKFKQSERIGFRRFNSKNASPKDQKTQNYQLQQIQQLRKSQPTNGASKKDKHSSIKDCQSNQVMTPIEYVSGRSFQGTYTIDSNDPNTPARQSTNKLKNTTSHLVNVAQLQNQSNINLSIEYDQSIITHFQETILTPDKANSSTNIVDNSYEYVVQQSSQSKHKTTQSDNMLRENLYNKSNVKQSQDGQVKIQQSQHIETGASNINQINEDLTQVIVNNTQIAKAADGNTFARNSEMPSLKSTRRDQQVLSPKFNLNDSDTANLRDNMANFGVSGKKMVDPNKQPQADLKSSFSSKGKFVSNKQARNETDKLTNRTKDYQDILNAKHLTEDSKLSSKDKSRANQEEIVTTLTEEGMPKTSIEIPLEQKVTKFDNDANDPASTAKFTATGNFADQSNLFSMLQAGKNAFQKANLPEDKELFKVGQSQSMQNLDEANQNAVVKIKKDNLESDIYQLNLESQEISGASRQNNMVIQRKSAAPIVKNMDEISPLVLKQQSSDSLAVKDQNYNQSVVMSIYSASRKRAENQEGEQEQSFSRAENLSENHESLQGGLSPRPHLDQFLANAIYDENSPEKLNKEDQKIAKLTELRSRSMSDAKVVVPANIANLASKGSLSAQKAKQLHLNRLKISQQKLGNPESAIAENSASNQGRDQSRRSNNQANNSRHETPNPRPQKHIRPNTSAIVQNFQGNSSQNVLQLPDKNSSLEFNSSIKHAFVEQKTVGMSSRHSTGLKKDSNREILMNRSSKHTPRRQMTMHEPSRSNRKPISQRGGEKSFGVFTRNEKATKLEEDTLAAAAETLEVKSDYAEHHLPHDYQALKLPDDQNLSKQKFIITKRLDTESNCYEKIGEAPDSTHGKEFNLMESDLNDEGYAEQLPIIVTNELTLGKSPIRIQTTTFNKTPVASGSSIKQNQLSAELGRSHEKQNLESSVTEHSIIAIGEAAYPQKCGSTKAVRLSQFNRIGSAHTSQRETFKTSQVIMGPQEFNPMSKMGNYIAQILKEKVAAEPTQQQPLKQSEEQKKKNISANDESPYMNYLQQTQVSSNAYNSSQVINLKKLATYESNVSDLNVNQEYQKDSVTSTFQRRPKTSMHNINSIQRELSRSRQDKRQNQLLKRNISMQRRKSQLLLKGQLEKSKRIHESSVAGYYLSSKQGSSQTRAQSSQCLTRPMTVTNPSAALTQNHQQESAKNSSGSVSGGIQMSKVYSNKLKKPQQALLNVTQQKDYEQNNNNNNNDQSIKTYSQDIVVDTSAKQYVEESQATQVLHERARTTTDSQQDGPPALGVTQSQSIQTTAIVIMNQTDGMAMANHKRTDTRALIQNDHSPVLTAKQYESSPSQKVESGDATLIETPIIEQTTQVIMSTSSRLPTGQASYRKGGQSQTTIRTVQQLLTHNAAEKASQNNNIIEDTRNKNTANVSSSQMSKEMMIQAALSGQPAQGVGQEIQLKRERIKQIYKDGLRKPGRSSAAYNSRYQQPAIASSQGRIPKVIVTSNNNMQPTRRTIQALGYSTKAAKININNQPDQNAAFSITGSKLGVTGQSVRHQRKAINQSDQACSKLPGVIGVIASEGQVKKLEIRANNL